MNNSRISAEAGYSPDISIDLLLHGESLSIAALGEADFLMRNPIRKPAGLRVLRITVGGKETIYEIHLPLGIDPDHQRQCYQVVKVIEEAAA
jgi:hypothetical protein